MTRHFFITKLLALTLGLLSAAFTVAQSTSQEFPTAITTNEISGTIKARDLGDSRLTTYYYALNGDQGDLFINLVTRNFTGDIDIFTVSGLRPMAKIVVYADFTENETGRAIYLRKPEKLLLRIQGRTPNDDPATFQLKFAGSFVAARAEDVPAEPQMPKVSSETLGTVRVNSVGTILPPPPRPVETVAEKEKSETEPSAKTETPVEPKPAENEKTATAEKTKAQTASELVVSDPVKPETPPKPARVKRTSSRRTTARRTQPKKPAAEITAETVKSETEKATESAKAGETEKQAETVSEPAKAAEPENVAEKAKPDEPEKALETKKAKEANTLSFRTLANSRKSRKVKTPPEPKPDPLASINLIIQLKDGNTIEKKMSEVFKFSVDKGILTVILKDGSISRYPIVDVAKVTIE